MSYTKAAEIMKKTITTNPALDVYAEISEGHISEIVDDRALLRKIDLRLMPLLQVLVYYYCVNLC